MKDFRAICVGLYCCDYEMAIILDCVRVNFLYTNGSIVILSKRNETVSFTFWRRLPRIDLQVKAFIGHAVVINVINSNSHAVTYYRF